MITKRVKKHLSIAKTRVNQKKELNRIEQYKNVTLHTVKKAFLNVINADFTKEDVGSFERCEAIRSELLENETVISYSVFDSEKTALVKDICRKGASSKKGCQFLYELSKKTRNPVVLEIGTNVGISGSYILEGLKNKEDSLFISMEGLPGLCEIANNRFSLILPKTRFKVIQGLFDVTFPQILKEDNKFNLLFIDGNHQKEATLAYFKHLKNKISSPAILVFDDINWSKGMIETWEIIRNDSKVNYSIDLHRQGIVIIDEQEADKNVEFTLHLSY